MPGLLYNAVPLVTMFEKLQTHRHHQKRKDYPEYAWGFDLIGPEQPNHIVQSVCCLRFVQPNFQWPSVCMAMVRQTNNLGRIYPSSQVVIDHYIRVYYPNVSIKKRHSIYSVCRTYGTPKGSHTVFCCVPHRAEKIEYSVTPDFGEKLFH